MATKIIFVSASSHRARSRLEGRYGNLSSHYRVFGSKSKGPHYVYGLTEEQAQDLKARPLKGCGRVRCQDESQYGKCWKMS